MRPGAAAASSSLRPGFLRKVSLKHQGFIVCQCSIPVLSLDTVGWVGGAAGTAEKLPGRFGPKAVKSATDHDVVTLTPQSTTTAPSQARPKSSVAVVVVASRVVVISSDGSELQDR